MPKILTLVLLLLVFVVCSVREIRAQSTEFTFQGSLMDNAVPANGNYDFEFALFDMPLVGSQVGATIPKNNVVVTNGIFSVKLDFGSVFPGADRYLEIHVRLVGQPGFTTLAPRQLVNSAPYSVKSLNTDNASQLGGVDANQYVLTGDARLSDARNPLPGSAGYIQNQNAAPQVSADFSISGSGTAGGTLSGNIVNAATRYDIGGSRVLSVAGAGNVFAGVGAGGLNTGFANAFFGAAAGDSNTTGSSNSFFGRDAGRFNMTGSSNSFFGNNAGNLTTTGGGNSFFGRRAGQFNTTGIDNSFFGRDAGVLSSTGGSNAFFGGDSGNSNTTGASNSFFGFNSGGQNTVGFVNSFFGVGAGSAIVNGNGNTAIGGNANFGNGALLNATAVGRNAFSACSNCMVLGGISGINNATADTNVGIGTTTPAERFHVAGNGLFTGDLTVNGALTASLPAGSANYIQNQSAAPQALSNFNISGNGTAGGTLSANTINAFSSIMGYQIGGSRVLSNAGTNNLFAGVGAGQSNMLGSSNAFFGQNAGQANTGGSNNAFFGARAGQANTTGGNSFFGASAGLSNTTGNTNSFFGLSAGQSNTTAGGNAFFGANAGVSNTTGGGNAFFGAAAGLSNTIGVINAFFGESAGSANTTGSGNAFFGTSAGSANTTANSNAFFGAGAGDSNTTGDSNAFFGRSAGQANTTADSNAFFGRDAGFANTTGGSNAFFGALAGQLNTEGFGNAFFGRNAGVGNSTGDNNVFFGRDAGFSNTTGSSNTFFGTSAGNFNTIGSNNTIIGEDADVTANNLTNATAIGARAAVGASNSLVLGSITGVNGGTNTNVGIGTTLPAKLLHVSGVGSDGPGFTDLQITGTGTIGAGVTFESTGTGGRTYSLISSASGAGAGGGKFAVIDVTGNVYRMVIDNAGNVGIGTLTPDNKLDVNGAISFTILGAAGATTLCRNASNQISTCSSSLRYKTNISHFSHGMLFVRQLRPITFDWKDGGMKDVGFGAEDVEKIDPRFVTYNDNGEVEGVKYDRVGVVLVNAVKEQQTQIEAQQKQIEALTFALCSLNPELEICKQK